MSKQDAPVHICRSARPTGQALVVPVPKGLDPELAERSIQRLLDRQPITRFPIGQQIHTTEGGGLAIRGLGHDTEDIMKFGREVEAVWLRVTRNRRVRRIALPLIALLALLVAVEAWTTDDSPSQYSWTLFEIGEVKRVAVVLNDKDGLLAFDESDLVRDIELALLRKVVPMRSPQLAGAFPLLAANVDTINLGNGVTYLVSVQLMDSLPTRIHGLDWPLDLWRRTWFGTTNRAELSMNTRDRILQFVDEFADDYLRANSEQMHTAVRNLQQQEKQP